MNDTASLKDRWIVVTRPAHQAVNFIAKLEQHGAHVIPFPLLEIIEPEDIQLVKQQVSQLKHKDIAIFISPNAVQCALKYVDKQRLRKLKIAAVGKKTASALQQAGIKVDYFPDQIFNSEALLALTALQQQQVQEKQIVIFRGEGGRNLLRDTLQSRGASVDYLNVYARRCPASDLDVLKDYFQQKKLDIIILTSGESFSHLLNLSNDENWLTQIPVLVGSQRIAKKFQQQLKGKIYAANDPSDETIYTALQQVFDAQH